MHYGLAKVDITPRLGVELYGFGPFLHRHAKAVRTPLYARALAVSDGENTCILVSCDLVGLSHELVQEARERVSAASGVPAAHVCYHCTHTHSGPATKFGIGQGEPDMAYLEVLPVRLAEAALRALDDLAPAELRHAVVPCEGIGYNREHDTRPPLEEALREDWRPAMPELTDTEAHVLRLQGERGLRGFASYFSCHPVVGSASNLYIHGDFPAVATGLLEREHPGSMGLFLQGCEGNINSCVVHHGEQESLLALDVIASRYARQIRVGLDTATPLKGDGVNAVSRRFPLTRAPLPIERLREELAACEVVTKAPAAADEAGEMRAAAVRAVALRRELSRQARGDASDETVEVQALRLGGVTLVGAPLEIMRRYRVRVQAEFETPVLVMSLCNGASCYAPERESFDLPGNYAAQVVPYLVGCPPLAPSVEDELVAAMVSVAREANASAQSPSAYGH